jgi:alkylation response protein AidB-like acyl-CoA dehydrogenase
MAQGPEPPPREVHMDGLDDEESAVVALVREFVDREVRPVVRQLEHADAYPEKLIEQMKELGVFGLAVPEPWGETKVSAQCYAAVTEELARGWMSLAGAMGGHTVVAKLLVSFGTEEQQDRYLPKMATGEIRATMALTEPGGGSDLQAMRTAAGRGPDGGYIVNGSKTWISNARRSQLVALLCRSCWWSTGPASPSAGTCPSSATRAWRAASWSSTTSTSRPARCSGGPRGKGSRR